MRMYFRYVRTELKRALEGVGFWLGIAAVAAVGFCTLSKSWTAILT